MHSPWPARAPLPRAPRAPAAPLPCSATACPARLSLACAPSASTPYAPHLRLLCTSGAPTSACRAPTCACCAPRAPSPVPCRRCSGCIAIHPCLSPLPSHNTVNCIAIQFSLLQPFCHNTLDCIAIQSKPTQQPLLQYTPVYCNPNSTL